MSLSAGGRRHSRRLPRSRWLWAERPGGWTAACTRAEWEAIQEILAARSRKPYWTNVPDGWCRNVLRFAGQEDWRVRLDRCANRSVYRSVDPVTGRGGDYRFSSG